MGVVTGDFGWCGVAVDVSTFHLFNTVSTLVLHFAPTLYLVASLNPLDPLNPSCFLTPLNPLNPLTPPPTDAQVPSRRHLRQTASHLRQSQRPLMHSVIETV